MFKKLTILATLIAILIFAGQAFANGPGSQNRGLTRAPAMPPAQQAPMAQQRTMERQQMQEHRPMQADQRGERQSPQATLPEQASDTARTAVESAGMGTDTAEAVKATTQEVAAPTEPETTLPGGEVAQ